MYIAMNRFQVKKGSEKDFETVWATRESFLTELDGFIEFHLLRGPVAEDHQLYSTHTLWKDYASFEAWTKSEQFAKAHKKALSNTGPSMHIGHPKFEGFEIIQSESKASAAA